MKILIVTDERFAELDEMLGGATAIIPDSVWLKLITELEMDPADLKRKLSDMEYNFGGEADCWIEFVEDEDHLFCKVALRSFGPQEEDE